MQLLSRQSALEQGLPRYFTGKPCLQGHVSERYTHNKTCCACANATANKSKAKNRKKYSESSGVWQRMNPEKVAEYQRARNKRFPGLRNLWTANYRNAKATRMPAWLNDGQLFEMESAYTYCAALRKIGLDYHVDHIVPLRGKMVSGLHVPWNLQVIPGRDNMSKGNRFQ